MTNKSKVLNQISRFGKRPEDVAKVTGLSVAETKKILEELRKEGDISVNEWSGVKYYNYGEITKWNNEMEKILDLLKANNIKYILNKRSLTILKFKITKYNVTDSFSIYRNKGSNIYYWSQYYDNYRGEAGAPGGHGYGDFANMYENVEYIINKGKRKTKK